MSYSYFVKLTFKVYGSTYHTDQAFLGASSYHGFYFGVFARMGSPWIMSKIGFKKTYLGVLIIQTVVCITFPMVAKTIWLFRVWVVLSIMSEGSTMSLFTPFSG